MRGAQTIGRLGRIGCVGAWLTLFGASACDSTRKRPTRQRPPHAAWSATPDAFAAESAPSTATALPEAVAQALEEVRERKLEILPPRDQTLGLCFGKGRLAQAAHEKVVFIDAKNGGVVAESALGAVYAVSAGVDGSLFALGLSGGARLEPHGSKPRSFPHVAFFPGAALFPDLQAPSQFYVYYGGEQQLFHFAFEVEAGTFLPIEDRFPLEGCAGAPVLLRDGAFACTTADGIERRAPRGREARFKLPVGVAPAVRLLPAKRLDELFSVALTGEVVRLRLQAGLPVLGRFQLPALPFAAAANGDALAFVLVTRRAPGSARQWTLLVTDFEGQERFEVELPSKSAEPSEDWLEAMLGSKNLALSGFEPLVAVGGADAVGVWDYAQGTPVFAR